jgi:YD repeat-containing protein
MNDIKMETVTYNSAGSVTYIKNMYGVENFWEYDSNNNVVYNKQVSPSGNIKETWIDYNEDGRLIHINTTSSNGLVQKDTWFFYDDRGNRIASESSDGTVSYMAYDENNRMVYRNENNKYHEWYSYDESGISKVISSKDFFESPDA